MGTPIINLPQTGERAKFGDWDGCLFFLGVLGLHAIKDKPVAINGKVEIRPVSRLALFAVGLLTHRLDDVPGSHIRPSSPRWEGSCDILGEGGIITSS